MRFIYKKHLFFSKLHLSPTQWNWKTAFAAFWRPAHYWIKKAFLQTKMSCIWRPKFCHFKMDVIKWCLNSCLVPHTSLILKSLICAYDFRPNNTCNNVKKILWSGEVTKVLTFVNIEYTRLFPICVTLQSPCTTRRKSLAIAALVDWEFSRSNLAVKMYLIRCSQPSITVPFLSI